MSLHGEIKVNHHEIGHWSAQRCGAMPNGDFIYRCTVETTDLAGYTHKRRFFVHHPYSDGALALTGLVMLESVKQMNQPERSDSHAMMDFCDMHHIDYPAWV